MVYLVSEEPEIFQIQVELPHNPLGWLNSYVIKGKERTLVIDTGFNRPECWESLRQGLEELHVDFRKTDLFITHLHSDHTGLVWEFVNRGSRVFMSAIDHLYLKGAYTDHSAWNFMENWFLKEGMPQSDIDKQKQNQAIRFTPKEYFPANHVNGGDVLDLGGQTLEVIHTPGHTQGLCCLYIRDKQILFTSDHILFDITPNITSWRDMKNSLKVYLDSLEKIRSLPVRLALPGHRKGDTSIISRVDEIKTHHRRRLDEVVHIVRTMPDLSVFEIAAHMTWSLRGKPWNEVSPTQKWFAMGETLSHIEYLLDDGELQPKSHDGRTVYVAAH